MSDAVLVAIITGIFAVVGQWMIIRSDRKKRNDADLEKEKKHAIEETRKEEKLNARLNTIERTLEENNKKLDIHNGYADKIGQIQQDIAYIKGKWEERES